MRTATPATRTALDVEIEVRRMGRGRARAAHRRAGSEDALHRARRHERGARRSLCRHGRQALARPVVSVRASRVHRRAQAPPGQPRRQARQLPDPEADRIGGALRLHRRHRRHPRRVVLLRSRRRSITATRRAGTGSPSTSDRRTSSSRASTAARARRATSTTCSS